MRYKNPEPITRQQAEVAFASGEPDRIAAALLSVVYHDTDFEWAQEHCLRLAHSPDAAVKPVAITCLGHLARIHRRIDHNRALPLLTALLNEPVYSGAAGDALDDIKQFAGGG